MREIIAKNKFIIISTYAFGLLAYMFFFTNLILNIDSVSKDCATGATISSGRWGLFLFSQVLTPYLMPWFIGILSLTILSITNCIIARIYEINNHIMQTLISGIIVTFPSFLIMYCYIHTAIPYSLSFLLSVLAVYFFSTDYKYRYYFSTICIVLSLSIYQGYLSVLLTFILVYLIFLVTKNQNSSKILYFIVKVCLCLSISGILYYSFTKLSMLICDEGFNSYAKEQFSSESNLYTRFYNIFINYILFFTHKYKGLINTDFSQIIHYVLCICLVISFIINKKYRKNYILIILLSIYPIAVNIFEILTPQGIYAMILAGFTSIYLLLYILYKNITHKTINYIIYISFTCIILNNIFIANKTALKLHLQYQNAYSFYTSLVANIHLHPEYNNNIPIALIGEVKQHLYNFPKFEKDNLYYGENLINSYSKVEMIKTKLGYNAHFIDGNYLKSDYRFKEMNIYPYYGSIQKIDSVLVIKLGE